jgi:DNA-binding GntR family transcriptional regulator
MTSDKANPLANLDLQLESTAEQVAAALREAIIDGRLAQGAYLREEALSKRFNVSRNTIREATQILVGERLATRQMHRGAYVSRIVVEDVRDVYRVRRLIELPAVDESASLDREELRAAVRAFSQAIEVDDRRAIVDSDLRFHRGIVSAMQSDRLSGLFDSLEGELRLCMALVGGSYPDPRATLREHDEILAALDRGDGGRARELLAAHLDEAERGIAGVLAERESAAPESA